MLDTIIINIDRQDLFRSTRAYLRICRFLPCSFVVPAATNDMVCSPALASKASLLF